METRHAVTDPAKVETISADMTARGWQGAPLVADGETLITGVHRYAAWRQTGQSDSGLPTVDIRDLFGSAGMDYDALVEDYTDGGELDWASVIEQVLALLPATVREQYGIEC